MNKFVRILLIASFIKEIVWIAVVPLWHFPDEQSHFGQLAYTAEMGKFPNFDENNDLTEEIRLSEELLGTLRDSRGNNKFTFHPEYRIEYVNGYIGKYEEKIKALAKQEGMRRMVKHEASRYATFYYATLSSIYRLFYWHDLIFRVFSIRIVQALFSVGVVYFAYRIGKEVFPKNPLYQISIPTLVSFHPMFSFVGAGVNSDNIGIFVFSWYLLLSVQFLRTIKFAKHFLILIVGTFLVSYFKPQYFIVYPLTIGLFFSKLFSMKMSLFRKFITSFTVIFGIGVFLKIFWILGIISPTVFNRFLYNFQINQFLSFLKSYALPHLYREVLPWYWGVYDWLGVTYPRLVYRSINAITLFSLFGLVIFPILRKRVIRLSYALFFIVSTIILFLGIYMYDWLESKDGGFHLGVQGRYFLPLIIAQLASLLTGWLTIFARIGERISFISAKFLMLGMIIFNWYALYTVARTYYDVSSISTFLFQISQYKPWFLKNYFVGSLLIIYFILTFIIGSMVIKFGKKNSN